MKVNLVFCLFVLESEKNINIRKNDLKKLKILVDKNNCLPEFAFRGGDIKEVILKEMNHLIGSNIFHCEQAYTMGYLNSIDIIYYGATNLENIKKINKDYKLIDFKLINNNTIFIDNSEYKYKTLEIERNNNIEYIHEIATDDEVLKRNILNLLISYKKIRSNIDNTDILFKFLGSSFTLEDVRMVYELIKDKSVDKSNFRKKIVKYCEKIEDNEQIKKGYRPTQKYKFKPLKGDVWL